MIRRALLLFTLLILGGCVSGRYPHSDHYDGSRFHNVDPKADAGKSFFEVLKWKWQATPAEWPEEKLQDLATPQISEPVPSGKLRVTFINHATALVEWSSLRVLTDPVLSEKLGPLSLLNLKRYRDPGLTFEVMPKIDYIFISHNHYDHLDLPTLKKIDERDKPHYIVPLGVGDYLPKSTKGRVTELDWWQSMKSSDGLAEFTLTPAQHWSKRTLWDLNASLWAGVFIKAQNRTFYYAGDAGYSKHFTEIKEKLGAPDVAFLPIGAYEPRWFMRDSHMDPAEAAQAHRDLGAKHSLGAHFGTFRLTDEGIDAPKKELEAALQAMAIPGTEFQVPKNGETFLY